MMKHIILTVCLLSFSAIVYSQKLFTADTIVSKKDTILITISNYRGILKWEKSIDSKIWSEIGIKSDSLYFQPDRISFIRGKIHEKGCTNYYSDTLLVNLVPKLIESNPNSIDLGDTITLKGYNLTAWGNFKVKINDIVANIIKSCDSIITTTIPLQLKSSNISITITLLNTSDTLDQSVILFKPIINSVDPQTAHIGDTVYLNGNHFCIEPSCNRVYFGFRNQAKVIFAKKNKLKVIVPDGIYPNRQTNIVSIVADLSDTLKSQLKLTNAWLQRKDAPGGQFGRYFSASFSIGETGYMGLGLGIGFTEANDFWKYDYKSDLWTKLNNFPGGSRSYPVSMVINDTAYVGCGRFNGTSLYDFWKYIPNTDSWKRVADIPTNTNAVAATFSIGGKGYLVFKQTTNNFWEYDAENNAWTQKPDFIIPDNNPYYPESPDLAFVINNKGYLLTNDNTTALDQLWEYDPAVGSWEKRANQIDDLSYPNRIVFVINNEAYLFPGYSSEIFARYNPINDKWVTLPRAKLRGRHGGVVFVFNNIAYIGTGMYYSASDATFWEFDPVYLNK